MLVLEERPLVHVPPAKHWRNWYRVYRRMRMTSRVGIWEPGIIRGPDLFPSKEIAEQHALELRIRIKPFAKSWYDHICALPEGEQPS